MKSSVGFYGMMANPASSDNHAEGQKMHEKGWGNAAGRFIIHQINHQLTVIYVLKIVGLCYMSTQIIDDWAILKKLMHTLQLPWYIPAPQTKWHTNQIGYV